MDGPSPPLPSPLPGAPLPVPSSVRKLAAELEGAFRDEVAERACLGEVLLGLAPDIRAEDFTGERRVCFDAYERGGTRELVACGLAQYAASCVSAHIQSDDDRRRARARLVRATGKRWVVLQVLEHQWRVEEFKEMLIGTASEAQAPEPLPCCEEFVQTLEGGNEDAG